MLEARAVYRKTVKFPAAADLGIGLRCPDSAARLSLPTWRLFHGHTLCEIARFIDIAAQLNCQVIREKLKRDDSKNGHYVLGHFRQHDYFIGNFFEALRAVSAGHRNDGPLARLNLFDV